MISGITLRNFKCFRKEDLPLGPVTLLAGLNSAGKSTVIQSLLLLRQSHRMGFLKNGKLAINGDLLGLGTGRDILNELAEEDEIAIRLAWDDGRSLQWRFAYLEGSNVLPIKSGPSHEDIPDCPPFGGVFHFLSAERLGPRTIYHTSDYSVEQLREVGAQGEFAVHYLERFGDDPIPVSALHHSKAPGRTLRAEVEAWLSEVSPGVRLRQESMKNIDAMQLRFAFIGSHGPTNDYRASNVGFGLTYSLPILVAVLSAAPGTLIALENPEAHLHPRGQVALARLLGGAAAQGVQILLETHSDHILNGLRLAVHDGEIPASSVRILYFQRLVMGGDVRHVVSTPTLDEKGRIDNWPDGFFDEWEKALDRLIDL